MTKNDKRLRGSVFVLSGEELTIPFGEIRALVLTYEPSALIQRKARRIITSTLSDEKLIEKVTQRAAYCRFGGKLISESNEASSLTQDFETDIIPKKRTFAVDSVSLTMYQCGEIGAKIKSMTNAKVSLGNPDYVFQAEAIPEGLILGLSKQGYKIFEWRHRRPRSRRFFLPSAIYPKLARALVNLSRVRENERFVDPFCGTGSLLIESSMMGMKTIGIDITRWIARGAALNLKKYSLDYESIIIADSIASFPISKVDAIATDVPYGRASSTKGIRTEIIMKGFLDSAGYCLCHSSASPSSSSSRKKYVVLMHPSTIDINQVIDNSGERGNSFRLEEQHLIYVHRNLTRAISVLEKTAA